jgi:hypothetical protein
VIPMSTNRPRTTKIVTAHHRFHHGLVVAAPTGGTGAGPGALAVVVVAAVVEIVRSFRISTVDGPRRWSQPGGMHRHGGDGAASPLIEYPALAQPPHLTRRPRPLRRGVVVRAPHGVGMAPSTGPEAQGARLFPARGRRGQQVLRGGGDRGMEEQPGRLYEWLRRVARQGRSSRFAGTGPGGVSGPDDVRGHLRASIEAFGVPVVQRQARVMSMCRPYRNTWSAKPADGSFRNSHCGFAPSLARMTPGPSCPLPFQSPTIGTCNSR